MWVRFGVSDGVLLLDSKSVKLIVDVPVSVDVSVIDADLVLLRSAETVTLRVLVPLDIVPECDRELDGVCVTVLVDSDEADDECSELNDLLLVVVRVSDRERDLELVTVCVPLGVDDSVSSSVSVWV